MFGIGSLSDPFRVEYLTAFQNLDGKAIRSSRLVEGERTKIIVGLGQSNSANSENALYTPTNTAKIDNLNVYDGGIYSGADPLLGAGFYSAGGCWQTRLADKLISGAFCDRVILGPIGRGSTSVLDWTPGGFMYPSLAAVCRRFSALGLTISAFLWVQGEDDHGMAQDVYRDALMAMINSTRADGFVAPWLIGKSTYTQGNTDANVRAACASVVNGTTIFAGADTDGLVGANRYDDVHFSATGANAAADLWASAVTAASI